jgi:hypothetical protein
MKESRTEARQGSMLSLVAVVAGVFALQMLFVWSYVDALHDPDPDGVPVAIVGPKASVEQVRGQLERGNDDFELVGKSSEDAARTPRGRL